MSDWKSNVDQIKNLLRSMTVYEVSTTPEVLEELTQIKLEIEEFFKMIRPSRRPLNIK